MGMIRDDVSEVMLLAAAFVVLPWSLSLLLVSGSVRIGRFTEKIRQSCFEA